MTSGAADADRVMVPGTEEEEDNDDDEEECADGVSDRVEWASDADSDLRFDAEECLVATASAERVVCAWPPVVCRLAEPTLVPLASSEGSGVEKATVVGEAVVGAGWQVAQPATMVCAISGRTTVKGPSVRVRVVAWDIWRSDGCFGEC